MNSQMLDPKPEMSDWMTGHQKERNTNVWRMGLNRSLVMLGAVFLSMHALGGGFEHPGMGQTAEDLAHLRRLIEQGQQPWASAFEKLKSGIAIDGARRTVTHISQGGYGANDQGGALLRHASRTAYDAAVIWYLSGETAYAAEAMDIINAWSATLWDFDDNNAKLVAAGSVEHLCKAAELLRHSDSGWRDEDIRAFEELLMTVYYPLLRYYFPDANGNWDGYIIRAIMCMGIFMDNREMFDNAIDHFLYAPINGSLFKYIYPSGQCQESTRDHGHVQMGLGAFANVAQIAHTQGVDLFSIGDNRLGEGIEYEARFLLGNPVFCYGLISERNKELSNGSLSYWYVTQHYAVLGVDTPYARQALEVLAPSPRNILNGTRVFLESPKDVLTPLAHAATAFPAGALEEPVHPVPADAISVQPGESLQEALYTAAGNGGCVLAKKGVHMLPATLRMPSGVTLSGEGIGTVLWLDPKAKARDAIVADSPDLHDVTICDLAIDGASRNFDDFENQAHRSYRNRQNRGGIMLHADRAGQIRNIRLAHVTVKNCTNNGVWITGASHVEVIACDFDENGAKVVPGPKLQHNLLLGHCSDIRIQDTRLDGSPYGSGLVLLKCQDAEVSACEIARNAHYGLLVLESREIRVEGCLVEGNDQSGVMLDYLYQGSEKVRLSHNRIHFNNGSGVEAYAAADLQLRENLLMGNRLEEVELALRRKSAPPAP
jgi:hypothetical protein